MQELQAAGRDLDEILVCPPLLFVIYQAIWATKPGKDLYAFIFRSCPHSRTFISNSDS